MKYYIKSKKFKVVILAKTPGRAIFSAIRSHLKEKKPLFLGNTIKVSEIGFKNHPEDKVYDTDSFLKRTGLLGFFDKEYDGD